MLTNKQKSFLRSMANTRGSLVQIGKDGVTYNLVQSLELALTAHELVKVNLLKTCPVLVREVALDLASQTNSEIVQIIGKTIVFYKKSKDQLISLPH